MANWKTHKKRNWTKYPQLSFYNDKGPISPTQIILPKQQLDEILVILLKSDANHPSIARKIQEADQKHFYPCLRKYSKTVTKCKNCNMNTRIMCPQFHFGWKDALQMDILPTPTPSSG